MVNLLAERTAIVTGAGRGIGREIALNLASWGCRVVVNDIGVAIDGQGGDAGLARSVVEEIRARGGEATASTESITSWDSAGRIVETALDIFGRIDIVVNNAGIARDRIFHQMNEEDWQAVVDVHLNGSFFVSRAAAPHFRAQGSGRYIHMTSASALVGNLGQASYSAAKLGVVALSKSIALDMERFGVQSNCICPFAWSRLTGSIPSQTPEEKARVEKIKTMEAAKIAPMVSYLASDLASGISGQIFAVRANELFVMSQNRPVRSVHRDQGWTPQTIAEHAIPAMKANFYPLDRSADIFSWDPI